MILGKGATINQFAFVDFIGDTTYSTYGLRIIRNSTGANATTHLKHRGTGTFFITTEEAADFRVYTNNTKRLDIDGTTGVAIFTAQVDLEAGLVTSGDIKADAQDTVKLGDATNYFSDLFCHAHYAGWGTGGGYFFLADSNTGLYRSAADELSIMTGGTERWRWHDDGSVSLGVDDAEAPKISRDAANDDFVLDLEASAYMKVTGGETAGGILAYDGVYAAFNGSTVKRGISGTRVVIDNSNQAWVVEITKGIITDWSEQ